MAEEELWFNPENPYRSEGGHVFGAWSPPVDPEWEAEWEQLKKEGRVTSCDRSLLDPSKPQKMGFETWWR